MLTDLLLADVWRGDRHAGAGWEGRGFVVRKGNVDLAFGSDVVSDAVLEYLDCKTSIALLIAMSLHSNILDDS